MHAKSVRVKLIAIFLVAFVCLNAGGALCVTYCRTAVDALAASQDHCPLKKKAEHCDPDKEEDNAPAADSISIDKIECCPVTVSFIGAPLETRTSPFKTAHVLVLASSVPEFPDSFLSTRQIPTSGYRGPPLDRRIERIKQRIIRI